MRGSRARSTGLAVAVLLLAVAGVAPSAAAAPQNSLESVRAVPGLDGTSAPATDTILVETSDPELRALAAELLPELTARSGLELKEPVRLERRSREELERYLDVRLADEMSETRARGIVAAYGHLGLMPPDTDLRALLLSVYLEQVAGFYDPDTNALYVLDDQDADALRPILLHELVHAVQDQSVDLDALIDPAVGNDRAKAAQAVIEGHATLVMLEQMTEQMQGRPIDLSEIPDFAGQIRPALEMARNEYPQLAAAPRIVQEALLFPYLEGAGYVLRAWEVGDRGAPLTSLLPASTEQLLDPSRILEEPVDHPEELLVLLDEGVSMHEDGLGQAEVRILLEERVGPRAAVASDGWDGDRYVVWERGGETGLIWASVWDSLESRDRFVSTLTPVLGDFPGGAELVALEQRERALAVLTVGAPLGYSVVVSPGPSSR